MNTIIKRQVGWISAIALGLLMQAAFADKVYVAGSGGIEVIDTDSNSVVNTIYNVGDNLPHDLSPLHDLAVNSDGTRLYVTTDSEKKLSVIDTKTDKVLNKIPLSLYPGSYGKNVVVNPSGTRVYVTNANAYPYPHVSVVDTILNKEITILDFFDINQIVFNPLGAYFYGYTYQGNNQRNISVFNANTNGLTATIPINSGSPDYSFSSDMVTTGTRLYVLSYVQKKSMVDYEYVIKVINIQSNHTESNRVVGNIPTGGYYINDMRVNSDGTRLYACAQTDMIVFNLTTNTLETTIPMIGGICSGIGINASGTRIYASRVDYNYTSRALHVIDAESNQIVSTISLSPISGITRVAVVSSAKITPIPRATARISNLNAQAQLPIIGGFGISGTGKLNLLFQGSAPDTCIHPYVTLRKYPSGDTVDTPPHWFIDYYKGHPSIKNLLSNPKDDIGYSWKALDLPAGYYTVLLDDALGCNEQGKLSIDIIEEDSSSSAKLINVSANAMLPITSTVTVKGTGSIQTMFRGFKVAPCVDANLELKNSPSGTLFANNDNWETDVNITEVMSLPQYLQPIDNSDAGLLRKLTAQSITATLSSKNACQGDGVFGMDVIHDAVDNRD
ncbi:MAG: YncE family protein [Thiotrichaceae bacterium]|nr:YncE family protein [Thiotrichaceae bacterium]